MQHYLLARQNMNLRFMYLVLPGYQSRSQDLEIQTSGIQFTEVQRRIELTVEFFMMELIL